MRSPGATRSGLRRPSAVGPRDEKYEMPKVCGLVLCTEPTAIASSRLAGSPMLRSRLAGMNPASLRSIA